MRRLHGHVAAPGTFLVSATRLGGQHGYDEAGAFAPMGGAVVGFTKAYKRERPEALVKAVDFEAHRNASDIAQLLVEETLRDPGAVEIGYKNGLRWTVGLREQPVDDGQPGLILNERSVFVVTGAAGSIVSAITADLAAASGGTFYLLDLVPEPDPKIPTWIGSSPTKTASSASCLPAFRRAANGPLQRWLRKNSQLSNARELRSPRSMRFALPAERRTISASISLTQMVSRGSSSGSANRVAASTYCFTPLAWNAATSCPTKTSASSIWCST